MLHYPKVVLDDETIQLEIAFHDDSWMNLCLKCTVEKFVIIWLELKREHALNNLSLCSLKM